MTRRTPPCAKRFAEPEITPPNFVIAIPRLSGAPSPRRFHDTRLETFGIMVLAPALVLISIVISFALLGIFVVWLWIIAALFAATVLADLVHRWRRWARPVGFHRRSLFYPGR
jgi:hypothetical protein